MPNAVLVPINGEDILVPTNREEAAIQNIILASQFRQTLQNALRHYKEKEMIPTPKELRDMAAAIRDCNETCSAVFDRVELPMNETSPQKPKEDDTLPDFTRIIDVTEKKDENI